MPSERSRLATKIPSADLCFPGGNRVKDGGSIIVVRLYAVEPAREHWYAGRDPGSIPARKKGGPGEGQCDSQEGVR